MTSYNLTASNITAAPSACVQVGYNDFDNCWLEIVLIDEEYMVGGGMGDVTEGEGLVALIESCSPCYSSFDIAVKGDITKPQMKTWNYLKDVLSLAKSHKRQEVEASNELLFGIELEFNHSAHSLKDLSPLLGMGIFKHDSSVDGEYVTLPYTYDEMVTKVTELADSFSKLLSANNTLTPVSEVGMHVHLSRAALTDKQINVLRYLFGGEVTPYISWLCERYPNRFCNYHFYCDDRHVAFNEENANTVEIRAFLSPMNVAGVLSNLKLVKAWLELADMTVDEWETKYPEFAYNSDIVGGWWSCREESINNDSSGGGFDGECYAVSAFSATGDPTAGWEVFEV